MRKMLVVIVTLGLVCSGCSWLNFWSDDSETTVAASEPVQAEGATTADPAAAKAAEEAPRAAAKPAAKAAARGAKSEAQIKAELDQMGHKLASQSARTLLPNKANKEVRQVGKEWVARYMDVDTDHVTTELRPGANGQYVGFIRYQEHVMECRGATKQAALSAPCERVSTRRLNELIRYDGREWQD